MNIRWLRTFVTAAEFENFRQTAERLYLAQPTVTVHIRHLEKDLGTQLFERTGRNIVLTKAGRYFLPHAQKIIKDYDTGMHDLISWNQGYEKKLTVSVSPLIASTFLPHIIKKFTAKHPNVEVKISVVDSGQIGEQVENRIAEIGLSRMKPFQPSLLSEVLSEDPVICVAPHDGGDMESSPPIDVEDLFETHILLTHNHPEYWDNLLTDIRLKNFKFRTMAVSQTHITKRFIEEGLGFSFLPRSSVYRELVEGRVLEVDTPAIDLPKATTYIVTKDENEEVSHFKTLLYDFYTT